MPYSCWLFIYVLCLTVLPTENNTWKAEVPKSVVGLEGSCVVIPCHFSYPVTDRKTSHLTGMWLTDSYEKVYHSVTSKISSEFQHRTSLWGDLNKWNCSLKINPLRHSDRGPFMFRIEIEDFEKFSFGNSKVSITIKDSPDQLTLSIPKQLTSGKMVTITCSVVHSCPSDPPNFTWSHKGALSSQSLQQIDGQWKITSSLSFTPSKTDHRKSLTCTAVFPGGKKVSNMHTLEVKYAPENVTVISANSVVEGSNLNMVCSSDGNPASHTYHWLSDAGTLLSVGHTFTLKNVSRHTGTIYCTAINTVGQSNSNAKQLNVMYPPEIKSGSFCTVVTTVLTCLCIVDSNPTSEIKVWGSKPSSQLQKTHEAKNGTLTIVTLQGVQDFSETVHCQATNSQGNYTMALQVSHHHETQNSKLLYISVAAIAFLLIIICLSIWIIKHCRRNESPQPKVELNVTSQSNQSQPERKCKDVSQSYDGSEHVYGNVALEGPYEEEYPYVYPSEYEETYANV